jgi:hypothetical protein
MDYSLLLAIEEVKSEIEENRELLLSPKSSIKRSLLENEETKTYPEYCEFMEE